MEMAFIAPVFLLLVFFGIQVGLWAYGRSVALAAAREGVAQLRVVPDAQFAAEADPVVRDHVERFATTIGRESLLGPRAATSWSADGNSVTVTVTGHVISLVPGLDLSTTQHASGTVERFGGVR
ncbi:TadE/TadG family type IV pilus assembly protein [Kineococcus aurantiacus]|uniref:TadE/TadG family type IV pilus assembly protein n=1 Tax=Kineococcus aurantiacus TaxID=37633 RepID=UPI0024833B4F|nr:TadE family protein [Kineococcus aurantiacus]